MAAPAATQGEGPSPSDSRSPSSPSGAGHSGPPPSPTPPTGGRAFQPASPPLAPSQLDEIIDDYLEGDLPLQQLAARHNLRVRDLLTLLDSPEVRAILDRLTAAAEEQAQRLATLARPTAIARLRELAAHNFTGLAAGRSSPALGPAPLFASHSLGAALYDLRIVISNMAWAGFAEAAG